MRLAYWVEKNGHYLDHIIDLYKVCSGTVLTQNEEFGRIFGNSYCQNDLSLLKRDCWNKFDAVVYSGDLRLDINAKSIFVNHGTSDKLYQLGLPLKEYHLVLLPGQRDYNRLEKRGLISSNVKIVGYMKFDRLNTMENIKLFDNDNKTIIYAPTWDINFKEMTRTILKLIEVSNNAGYNLIIKPHPGILSLMKTSNNVDALLVMHREISKLENIKFIEDYRSLEYLKISDLLITGVSSITYEALVFDIPTIFNNVMGIFPDYSDITSTTYSWDSGYVCNDLDNLDWLIKDSLDNPDKFKDKRKELLDYSFYSIDGKSCERAKKAIEEIL